MSDPVRLAQDEARGMRAERLLADELLVGAFDRLEADYIAAWQASKYNDTDGRERLWQAVQIVGKVKAHLASVVTDGTLAKAEIAQIERMGERKKIFGVV